MAAATSRQANALPDQDGGPNQIPDFSMVALMPRSINTISEGCGRTLGNFTTQSRCRSQYSRSLCGETMVAMVTTPLLTNCSSLLRYNSNTPCIGGEWPGPAVPG